MIYRRNVEVVLKKMGGKAEIMIMIMIMIWGLTMKCDKEYEKI